MTQTKLRTLTEVGQSVWLDYTERSFVAMDGLQNYIDKGLRGVTSNPDILMDDARPGHHTASLNQSL